jgi:uncharacterized protein DUF3237
MCRCAGDGLLTPELAGPKEPPGLEFLMQIAVEFEAPHAISGGPLGMRRILHVSRGSFEGPALQGTVMPGGGDWVLMRRDGAAELDIRFTLKTAADEIVYLRSTGLFVASEAVSARIRRAEAVDRAEYYFRTSILFEADSARLARLNCMLHLGVGCRTATGMATDIFAIKGIGSIA